MREYARPFRRRYIVRVTNVVAISGVRKLGVKGERIARQNIPHGFLALLFVVFRVDAMEATAVGTAINFGSKTLAI